MLFARLASRPTVPELDLGSKKTTQWIPTRQPPPPSESWSGSAGPTVIEPHADDGSFDTYDGKEGNYTNTKEHTTDKQSVVEDSQSDLGSTAYKSKATGPTPPVHSTQQAPEDNQHIPSQPALPYLNECSPALHGSGRPNTKARPGPARGWCRAGYYASFSGLGRARDRGKHFLQSPRNLRPGRARAVPDQAVYQCLDLVSEMADYPLSWFLTEQHVTPDDWKATSSLLDDVRESMSHFFDWMDESTKSIALDRLRALRNIVAYPSIAATKHSLETRYSFLRETVKPPFGRAYMETKRMVRVQRNRFLKKAMARQDNDWFSVPLVNAIFLPYYHIIVIPTSIMLPPLLVPQLPAATYGGMAHVLAHEVSHAFDVDAAPANADGLYREWYSPITRSRIQDRKLCLRDMYLVPVNLPWVTEGEDYADALGLTVAAKAFRRRMLPEAPSGVAQFSNEQLFYVSSCFKWCNSKGRPQSSSGANQAQDDVHSSMYRRCNAPLLAHERFFKAFNCTPGASMRPRRQCPFP
ncbi:neprilysin-1 [Ixodes scapularis]